MELKSPGKGLYKISAFIVFNFFIFACVIRYRNHLHAIQENYTPSFLEAISVNKNADFMFMGSSHVGVFLWGRNYIEVQKVLGRKVMVLAVPRGGVIPQCVMLSQFIKSKGSAENIIFFIDPHVFFSRIYNEGNEFYLREPFSFSLFVDLARFGIGVAGLHEYLFSKFSPKWEEGRAEIQITGNMLGKRMDRLGMMSKLYPGGVHEDIFNKYWKLYEREISFVKKQNRRIILIISPTMLGPEPGSELLLKRLRGLDGCEVYDFNSVIKDPKMFADSEHLNREGVVYFTMNYLRPLFTLMKPAG